jgi:hypothetical protein
MVEVWPVSVKMVTLANVLCLRLQPYSQGTKWGEKGFGRLALMGDATKGSCGQGRVSLTPPTYVWSIHHQGPVSLTPPLIYGQFTTRSGTVDSPAFVWTIHHQGMESLTPPLV